METHNKSLTRPITMTLYTGREVDIFNLRIEDIDIEDIAHSLSNLCRYGGHCLFHYSVALHSYLCSLEPGTKSEQLQFLLHDASEAYVNDLVRPIKHRVEMEKYREIEDSIQDLIFKRFNLPYPYSERVHEVDDKVLLDEIPNLIIMSDEIILKSAESGLSTREARKVLAQEKLSKCKFPKITPEEAKELFLNRFYELYE